MSYRSDPDLKFLKSASNQDLLLLADTLVYKDVKHKNKKSHRIAATLQNDERYKIHYPNNMKALWESIAEEIQKFGGHSGVNWIFRWNKGVLYREILIDVCKQQKIKKINYKNAKTEDIEDVFLETIIVLAIEKMSDYERRELIQGLRNIEQFRDIVKDMLTSKDTLIEVCKIAFKQGGFKSYILTLQIVNGISKTILGRGLTFGANAALMKYLGSFMSGPWGWAFTAVTTVWGFLGPNRDVCLKCVAIIAYMRKKSLLERNI